MDVTNFWWQSQAAAPAVIDNSLRFRGAQTLSRAVAGSGTMSVWIKRGKLGAAQTIAPQIVFDAGDTLNGSTALFRDPSAWMHIVVNNGNTWVNNQRVSGGTAPTSGTLGTSFEGYMAEVHLVDGQALAPTSFGEFNADGVWVPKKVSGVTYGTNGFYLDFSDAANIGKDRSGNNNDFTATGFELTTTTSTNYDWMTDSPTTDWSTWNPLNKGSNLTLSNGNLDVSGSTGHSTVLAAIGITAGMKSYMEMTVTTDSGGGFGVTTNPAAENSYSETSGKWWIYDNGVNFVIINQASTANHPPRISSGDVLQLAIDYSTGNIFVGINNTWINSTSGTDGNPATGANPTFTITTSQPIFPIFHSNGLFIAVNFGQQPFRYTPPAGFSALSTAELPAPNLPATITGTFTGNNSADGPFVYTGCVPGRIQYGTIDVLYQDRFAQNNVDFLANGFKVRSTTSNSGNVNYTVTTTHSGGEFTGKKVPYGGAGVSPATAVSN